MALQDARVRLHEDNVILRASSPKLPVGGLDRPDDLGWRWLQSSKTLQILLPPDVGIRYEKFLGMERQLLHLPSSHTAIQRYNKAREDFTRQCVGARPKYPVRGITPSKYRFALEPGFRCISIDEIVSEDADSLSMSAFGARLVGRSALGLLGPKDEWGRSWFRLSEHTQLLLPADITCQYTEFIQCSILSDWAPPGWEDTLANFTKICRDRAKYLGIYKGDRLYILERDSSAPVLASVSDILNSHYQRLAERAWTFANSPQPQITHHKARPWVTIRSPNRPTCIRAVKRKRGAPFRRRLEPLVEAHEDGMPENDADESEYESELSLEFSVTTTVLGSSFSLDKFQKSSRPLLHHRKTNFFTFPARVLERLRIVGGFV
ncbi:hypothetical protein D9757_010114 [Collybiopsis confluens]|uniref:Uncharacterized protein n=1 Tax=Collybiopsis confluens TaxID=2823264 RepID=A0A8H5GM63_9AGAR|nr:hypothetical protein D9757_010114 [Collybiopsis confluens]